MFLLRRVQGISMRPTLESAQILIFKKSTRFKLNQIVCAVFENQEIVKRVLYLKNGRVYLKGDNPLSRSYFVKPEDVKAVLIYPRH